MASTITTTNNSEKRSGTITATTITLRTESITVVGAKMAFSQRLSNVLRLLRTGPVFTEEQQKIIDAVGESTSAVRAYGAILRLKEKRP